MKESEAMNQPQYEACFGPQFTQNERWLVLDAFHGTPLDRQDYITRQPRSILMMQIEDSIRLDGSDRKWCVDGEELLTKIKSLSDAEATALIASAQAFWLGHEHAEMEHQPA